MTPKAFTVLGVLAGLSLAAAGVTYSTSGRWATADYDRSQIFPGLVKRVNEVERLTIKDASGELTIARSGDQWVMTDRGGYPADVARVRANIVGVAELYRIEPKTTRPGLYPMIEVEDPSLEGAKSRHFAMLDAGGETLASLIVGKRKVNADGPERHGAYVRLDGEERAWLAGGDIDISTHVEDWLDTQLFDLKVDDVTRMTMTWGSALELDLVRAQGGKGFNITGLPEGMTAKSPFALQSLVRRAVDVKFDNVRASESGSAPAAVAELETASGVTVSVAIHGASGERWVALSASGDGEAAAGAREINDRVSGFEFRLTESEADDLIVTVADVVETEGS